MIFLDNDTNSRQFWSFYFRCVCIWCMLRICFSYCSTCNNWKPLEFNYVLKANKKRRSKLYENQILQVKLMFKIGRKQPPVTLLCRHDANNNWWYITIYCNIYIERRPHTLICTYIQWFFNQRIVRAGKISRCRVKLAFAAHFRIHRRQFRIVPWVS